MSSRGRPAVRGRATALPSRSRNPSASEVRQKYTKRLDDLVATMLESFKATIASATVADRADNFRAEFGTQVETAKLAAAAEGILKLNSELKIAMIVQDIGESSQDDRATKTAFDNDTRRAKDELGRLQNNVDRSLAALEAHYYSSVPHIRVADAQADPSK